MKKDIRIDEVLHEATNEWFVYLTPGWQLDGAHCFGEDTRLAIRETMKRVVPCECEDCQITTISGAIDEVFRELKR